MPKLRVKEFKPGNSSWLRSGHGEWDAVSLVLLAADFTAVVSKYGFVPSGYPVVISDDKVIPVTSETVVPSGFVFDDVDGKFDQQVAVLVHGIVSHRHIPQLTNNKSVNKPAASGAIIYL